jgi:hypothetical protein
MNHWIDNIRYGNPTDNILPELQSKSSFDSLLDELKKYPYPSNSSEATQDELRELMQYQSSEEQRNDSLVERYIDYDKDLKATYFEFCEDNGLSEMNEVIEAIVKETKPLIAKLKYFYNRPRPFQLAYYYKAKLIPTASFNAMTPSYPSGHVLQAYLLSEVIGSKFPQHFETLTYLANDIEKSRLFLGLHFGTDNDFARICVQKILRDKSFTKQYGI